MICKTDRLPQGSWRSEEIPPGGWRAYRDVYRTKDGTAYFTFDFIEVGSHYEIDIVSQPSYGNRSANQHDTHRLESNRGGYRICLGDNGAASSLSQAKKWAGKWAELTLKYIRTGQAFPNN